MLESASAIEINGTSVASSSKGGRYEVMPGVHQVRVKTPGHSAVTRSIDVEPGGTAVLRIGDSEFGGDSDGSPE